MACTLPLGCGVDVGDVGVVMLYLTPWSITDSVQESGRGGQGGQKAWSFAFTSKDETMAEEDLAGKKTTRDWVLRKTSCRRTALSLFLNNGRTTCVRLNKAHFRDVCEKSQKQPYLGHLIEFSSPKITAGDTLKVVPPPLRIPLSSLRHAADRTAVPEPVESVAFSVRYPCSSSPLTRSAGP